MSPPHNFLLFPSRDGAVDPNLNRSSNISTQPRPGDFDLAREQDRGNIGPLRVLKRPWYLGDSMPTVLLQFEVPGE